MKRLISVVLILSLLVCASACGRSDSKTENASEPERAESSVIEVSDAKAFKAKSTKNEVGAEDIINYLLDFYPEGTTITKVHDVSQEKGETEQKMSVACSVDSSSKYAGCMANWTLQFERFDDAWVGTDREMGLYETTIRSDIDLSPFVEQIRQLVDKTDGMFASFDKTEPVLDAENGTIRITFENFAFDQYLCTNAPYTVEYTFNDYPSQLSWNSYYDNKNTDSGKIINIWALAGHYTSEYGDNNPWECDVVKSNGKYVTQNFVWSYPYYGYSGIEPEQEVVFTGFDIQLTSSSGGRIDAAPLAAVEINGDTMVYFAYQTVINNNVPLDLTDIPKDLWNDVIKLYGATSYVIGNDIKDNTSCIHEVANDKSLDPASHPADGIRIELSALNRSMKYSGSGESYRFEIIYNVVNTTKHNINEFYGMLNLYDSTGRYLTSIQRRESGVVIEANHSYPIDQFVDISGPAATYLYSNIDSPIKYEFLLDAIEYEDGYKLSHMMGSLPDAADYPDPSDEDDSSDYEDAWWEESDEPYTQYQYTGQLAEVLNAVKAHCTWYNGWIKENFPDGMIQSWGADWDIWEDGPDRWSGYLYNFGETGASSVYNFTVELKNGEYVIVEEEGFY